MKIENVFLERKGQVMFNTEITEQIHHPTSAPSTKACQRELPHCECCKIYHKTTNNIIIQGLYSLKIYYIWGL